MNDMMANEPAGTELGHFNLEADAVTAPLIPSRGYSGFIENVSLQDNRVVFRVQLNNNPGSFCLDNKTPVDGCLVSYNLWLPKEGDENIKSKFSSLTLKQEACNKIKKVSQALRLGITDLSSILSAIENKSWVGLNVVAKVTATKIKSSGEFINQISSMDRVGD